MVVAVGFVDPGPANLVALTENLHSKEALELVREHMLGVMGAAASSKFSTELIKMSKFQMAQVGVGSAFREGCQGHAGCDGCSGGSSSSSSGGRLRAEFAIDRAKCRMAHVRWLPEEGQGRGLVTIANCIATLVALSRGTCHSFTVVDAVCLCCAGVCCVHHVWLLPASCRQALPARVSPGYD